MSDLFNVFKAIASIIKQWTKFGAIINELLTGLFICMKKGENINYLMNANNRKALVFEFQ